MKVLVRADPDSAALGCAELLAGEAREAIAARGRFCLALSGGGRPGR
jgi:6-phosphogluconolactonase/glucosamine-6-phosphate isomerase/deaminase